jgi:hypothetical protein
VTTTFSNLKPLDRSARLVLAAVGVLSVMSAWAHAQEPLPNDPSAVVAAQNEALARPTGSGYVFKPQGSFAGPGGLSVDRAGDTALPLSLDDAMSIGLARNVRLKYDRANMRAVKGDTLGVLSALIPNLSLNAQSSAQELNLAAMGFKPSGGVFFR